MFDQFISQVSRFEIPVRSKGMNHPQLVTGPAGGYIEDLFRFISLSQV
jgi:hypothetical protein